MREFTYPTREINRDLVRSGVGMLITALPLLLFGPSSVIVYILVGLFLMFAIYGVRAAVRKKTQISISSDGIQVTGVKGKFIDWEALEALKLCYYSTRRDGEKGWMQLKLKGRGTRLTLESTISEFDDLVRLCAIKAQEMGVKFDATTARNLRSIGIERQVTPQSIEAEKGL